MHAGVTGFISNPACTPVTAIGVFSTPDPNFSVLVTSIINQPLNLVTTVLPNFTPVDVQQLRTDVLTRVLPSFPIDPACATRCGI